MRTAKLLLSYTALIALAGCAVGPDYQRPELPAAQQYTRTPLQDTVSAPVPGGATQRFVAALDISSQWWRAYDSPTINALVEQALEHNPNITMAKAALRQAQENVAAQQASYFPVVQASYSPSRQKNPVGTISPTLTSGAPLYTLHTAQVSISYVPDVFGLNRRTVESLAAQTETQQFQLEAAYLTLASNVVSAAIQQAALQSQIQATEKIIQAAEKTLIQFQRQAELGFASGLDVAAQETACAQAQQALPALQKQLEQTRDLLAVLVGKLPDQAGMENIDLDSLHLPETLPVSLPSKLIEQRPDVRAAEAQVHAASALVGVALANRLPQFSLSAAYGGSSTEFGTMFGGDNKFWSLTGNVTQTLFDFGALMHRNRAADAGLDQATAQYRIVVLAAFQNVADTLYALDADARTLAYAVKAEIAAKKTLELTRHQLDLGFVSGVALLSAEQAWQQTKIALIQAQAARHADTAALFQALGGGWWARQ